MKGTAYEKVEHGLRAQLDRARSSAKTSSYGDHHADPPPPPEYTGAPLRFEGGDRAPHTPPTRPDQGTAPSRPGKKPGSVHGVPGVEGMHDVGEKPEEGQKENHGFSCPHGCGSMKTAHGLARHIRASHGFGALGHGLVHGIMKREVPEAATVRESSTRETPAREWFSSYENGDRDGAYGRSRNKGR